MTRLVFLASLLCSGLSAYSQNNYNQKWLTDNYVVFDFSSGQLKILLETAPVDLGPGSTTTSICDKHGNLQFYSSGCFVGNRLHKVMENGDKINSDYTYTGWCGYGEIPISTSNTIIPYPSDSMKYFLFNLDMDKAVPPAALFLPHHLLYHVIDMSKNNGLGAVVEKKKIAIDDLLASGSLTAVRHPNGEDWWIVTPQFNSNCYYIVPVTSSGVGTPKLQCLGMAFGLDDGGGQATFSPNGAKYARIEPDNGLVLMDFNASSGQFSNPKVLEYSFDYKLTHGTCFSGNSRYLYVSAIDRIWQFDTEALDIQSTVQWVGGMNPDTVKFEQGAFATMKLGPDGKIYISCVGNHRWISSIERPNCPGLLCQARVHKIRLPANNYWTVHNHPTFSIPAQTYDCETVGTEEAAEAGPGITLEPNPATDHVMLRSNLAGRLVVFSTDGRQLAEATFAEGTTRVPFNLAPGLYFFRLMTGNNSVRTEKVVVH